MSPPQHPLQARPRPWLFHFAVLGLLLALDSVVYIRKKTVHRLGRVLLTFLLATMLLSAGASIRSLFKIQSDIHLMTADALTGVESASKMGQNLNDLRFEILHMQDTSDKHLTAQRVQAYAEAFAAQLRTYRKGVFVPEDRANAEMVEATQSEYLAALQPLIKAASPGVQEIDRADVFGAKLREAINRAASFNRNRLREIVAEAQNNADETLRISFLVSVSMAALVAIILAVVGIYVSIVPTEKPVE